MDEQPRPVETDRAMDRATTEAGYAPLPDYVARNSEPDTSCGEIDLLTQVAAIIRQAQVEFRGGFNVAGRLEIIHAQRLLDRAFHGEAV